MTRDTSKCTFDKIEKNHLCLWIRPGTGRFSYILESSVAILK